MLQQELLTVETLLSKMFVDVDRVISNLEPSDTEGRKFPFVEIASSNKSVDYISSNVSL